MRSLSNAVGGVVSSWGPEAAQALRRAQNKDRYRAAVLRTWRTRPEVASLVLRHTCSIFIAKDERLRKGPDKERDRWVFGVYLNDPMVRTEVDAWQSVLLQALHQEGIAAEELKILPATRDMRARRLFPDLEDDNAPSAVPGVAGPAPWKHRDESQALDTVKRAVVMTFEDIEQAWAFLEPVKAASLDEITGAAVTVEGEPRDKRQRDRVFVLVLYVDDKPAMQKLVDAFGDAVRCRARLLGLRIAGIRVCQAGDAYRCEQAFSRTGPSHPVRDRDILSQTARAPRSE